jgi:FtsP/CotA-like multicopper oxidase with cupredoxin domain
MLMVCSSADLLNITFTNSLFGLNSEESSAIHWHGLLQRGTNNMDGAALITQTLTAPNSSRIYTFRADVAGSFWYHAHWRGREVDGASGPLVVYKQSPTFSQYPTIPSFLDDTVIWLKDWYRYDSETLIARYLNKSNAAGIEPVPFTGLINGIGQSDSTSLQYASISLTRAVACVPQPGKKYVFPINTPLSKLRLITGSSFGVFTLTVENHLISIVQVGPSPVKPTDAMPSILVNAGERFDVVICRIPFRPGSDHPSQYDLNAPVYIQTTLVQSVFGESSPFPNTTAILSYKAYAGPHLIPNTTRPISSGQSTLLFDQNVGDQINLKPSISNLNSSIPLLVTAPSTKVITLTLNFAKTTDHGALPGSDIGDSLNLPTIGINKQTPVNWEYPSVLKSTSLYDLWSANKAFPPASEGRTNNWGINYINISQGDVVDIIVNNHDGGQHPLVRGMRSILPLNILTSSPSRSIFMATRSM